MILKIYIEWRCEMLEIKIIDAEHKQDINIPNEPFSLFGRMIPSYILQSC